MRHAAISSTIVGAEPYVSKTVVFTLERAFNLETCVIDSRLSKNGELHIECKKVPFLQFLIGLFRRVVDVVLVGTIIRGQREDEKVFEA